MLLVSGSHPLNELIQKLREIFLSLGFSEVVNPIIIDESEIYRQYGPEAPVILDRIYYLAGLPRPDRGLGKDEIARIKEAVPEIDIKKLKNLLRRYRKREIEADDLFEVFKVELGISDKEIDAIMNLLKPFFELKPIPTKKTLRSHMTGAWFLTLQSLSAFVEPPIKLFSIDWVFRREQRVDKSHLRYYHSASVVFASNKIREEEAKEITNEILSKISEELEISSKYKIKEKESVARYYDREWEVFLELGGKDYEIGTFGLYSRRALKNYEIPYEVYNFGIGVERLLQVITGEEDIRNVIFRERKLTLKDEQIYEMIKIPEPRTKQGKKLLSLLYRKAIEMKDKQGSFKQKVYENDSVEIFFLEPDEGKKFLGPAALNRIYVVDGNIISSVEEEKGIFLGTYLEILLRKLVSLIEDGFEGAFKVRWVNGPSDIFIEIPDKLWRYFHTKGKIVDIKGPVFFDAEVVRKIQSRSSTYSSQ